MQSFISRLMLPPPGHYVVAVSGGVDSMALLHMLATREKKEGWRLRVGHFNHGMRDDSTADQNFVREIAQVYSLPFHTANGNLGQVSEDVARKARYEFLQSLVDEYGADGIITAHHYDDRQETSLFNLARGSGARGAASLNAAGKLIRPLLGISKAELVEYANKYQLPWREDSTNTDLSLSRNFIRHEIVPLGRTQQPDFDQRFGITLGRLDHLNKAIDERFSQLLKHQLRSVALPRTELASVRVETLAPLILYMARQLDPSAEINQRTLRKAAQLAKTGHSGNEAALTGQLSLRITSNHVEVTTVNTAVQDLVAQDLLPEGSIRFGGHQLSYGVDHNDTQHHHIGHHELKVRTPKAGDRIAPLGLAGTKKLQDLFVDAKIDRDDRQSWPVVTRTSDDQVVWVPRLAISRHFVIPFDHDEAHCLDHTLVE